MKQSIDDRRYMMQQAENARRRAMEEKAQRENDEYLAALDSGDVSPEVEAELTESQAEKESDKGDQEGWRNFYNRDDMYMGGKTEDREQYFAGSLLPLGRAALTLAKGAKNKISSLAKTNFKDAKKADGVTPSRGLLTRNDGSAFAHMGDDVIRIADNRSQYIGAAKLGTAIIAGKVYENVTEEEVDSIIAETGASENEVTMVADIPTYSFADLPQQGAASIETKNKITYNNKQLNEAINKAKSEKQIEMTYDGVSYNTEALQAAVKKYKKINKTPQETASREEKMEGGMMKYAEGSMLVPPEMGMEDEIPEDTYDNIPEDEMAAVEASQLPDSEMEEDYTGYVLGQSLDTEEQEYLMGILETDERLSGIFDKVMDVAGEFSGEGSVEGPGTGTSDSIPARLSDGEFVFTKKATDQMGADQLQTMMDEAEKAYDGGYMKKAFGGLTSEDDIEMDSYDSEEEVKKQMIAANQMPSIR
jgi:hypothetical protein